MLFTQLVYNAECSTLILMYFSQGCSANKNDVGTHPKKLPCQHKFKLILKQNVKKVWDRHSNTFPPH